MNYGLMIKKVRANLNQTQTEFSKEIGISQTYLSQLEKCRKIPSTQLLEKIGDYCNIPMGVLFWFSVTEYDIKEEKKQLFNDLKKSIDSLIECCI